MKALSQVSHPLMSFYEHYVLLLNQITLLPFSLKSFKIGQMQQDSRFTVFPSTFFFAVVLILQNFPGLKLKLWSTLCRILLNLKKLNFVWSLKVAKNWENWQIICHKAVHRVDLELFCRPARLCGGSGVH